MAFSVQLNPVLSSNPPSLRSSRPRHLRSPATFLHPSKLCSAFRLASMDGLKPELAPFVVQAKRGGTSFKEDEVASASDLSFTTPLKIVEYPDPILRAKNKRIETFDDNLKRLVVEMFDIMYKTDGIGLSAPQVGINVRLMVLNPVGEPGQGEEVVLVNPTVYKYSKKLVPFDEGCLSFPGIYANVMRPEGIKIDALDIDGKRFRLNLTALPARIFQHEYDHLEGVLFFDRMSEGVLDSIRPQLQALEKKYELKTGSPSPERINETYKRKPAAVGFGKSS